jgi:hypothetical protein
MSEALRSELSRVMRDIWSRPEAYTLRNTLSSQAIGSGYAKCLEDLMARGAAGKALYEKCAKDKNIKTAFRSAWGKPA